MRFWLVHAAMRGIMLSCALDGERSLHDLHELAVKSTKILLWNFFEIECLSRSFPVFCSPLCLAVKMALRIASSRASARCLSVARQLALPGSTRPCRAANAQQARFSSRDNLSTAEPAANSSAPRAEAAAPSSSPYSNLELLLEPSWRLALQAQFAKPYWSQLASNLNALHKKASLFALVRDFQHRHHCRDT